MPRRYGRDPKGEQVLDAEPQHYGSHVTMLGALSVQGIAAVMTGEGATDAAAFLASVEHVLAPTFRPGDSVVMDNLRAHKVVGGQQALEGRGPRLLSLPPYAPALAPIARWSTLKTDLRAAKAKPARGRRLMPRSRTLWPR
jgi:transposase